MSVSLSVLVIIMVPTLLVLSQEGDFGILTACYTKNNSLRLECSYAPCRDSPPFSCKFASLNGETLDSGEQCNLTIPNHKVLYRTKTTIYTCTLTRKQRLEKKNITINYSTNKRKQIIPECLGATGLPLHHAPASLCASVALSLWAVLVTGLYVA